MASFALPLLTGSARAQHVWKNNITGNWQSNFNWTEPFPPDSSTDAKVNNGGKAQVTSAGRHGREVTLGQLAGQAGHVEVLTATATLSVQSIDVGVQGTGTLTVSAGQFIVRPSAHAANNVILGMMSGSSGTATVSGAGSTLNSSGQVVVGLSGTGVLDVSAGGAVFSTYGYVAEFEGSSGAATVADASSWNNSGELHVGERGSGTLSVSATGHVENTAGYVGGYSGSSGTATITGAGSTWTNAAALRVGNAGAGILAVTDGGHVTSQLGYVGYSAGSTGSVTVDGPGSSWVNSSELYVGNSGAASMHITNGGQVSNTGDAYLGAFGGSSGSVTVDGAGSAWTVSDYYEDEAAGLYLGYAGSGSLSVTNGGVVNAAQAMNGINVGTSGSIGGDGTLVGNVTNSGFVFPEGATGLLHIEGNYTQTSAGRIMIFADLFLPAGENPRLDVTGDVGLDGILQMNLSGMGRFRGTRSFDVLDWGGSLNGTAFATLQLPMFGGAFTWDTSQLYTSGVLTLTGPSPETDFNHDGVVDAADYVVWRKAGGPQSDYDLWHEQFGIAYNVGSGSSFDRTSSAAVPEPANLALLLLTAAGLLLIPHRGYFRFRVCAPALVCCCIFTASPTCPNRYL